MNRLSIFLLISALSITANAAAQSRDRITSSNLLKNGSFEDSPRSTFVPGWNAEDGGSIELAWENQSLPLTPFEGQMFVELDREKNTGIFQDITTVPGEQYYISFAYRNRQGSPASSIEVLKDGVTLQKVTTTSTTSWQTTQMGFTASNRTTRITLRGNGPSDGLGDLVDGIHVIHPSQIILPQFADGGGWRTIVTISNPTQRAGVFEIVFYDKATGVRSTLFSQTMAPGTTATYTSPNAGAVIRTGWLAITENGMGTDVIVSARYRYGAPGQQVNETGIAPTRATNRMRVAFTNTSGKTGIAIANPQSTKSVSVFFETFDTGGNSIQNGLLSLLPLTQTSFYLSTMMPRLSDRDGSMQVYAVRKCADEGGTCTLNNTTATIWYGAETSWVSRKVTDSTPCTNAVFTDPLGGTGKACYVRDDNTEFAAMGLLEVPGGTFTSLPY